eukprot:Skav212741  [mRNA]  locus=scaffold1199:108583:113900:+ [translate_table: standard]
MALVNRQVLVEYDVGGRRLWHERCVVEHVQGDNYIVVTPDQDVYMEELGLFNSDIRTLRVRPGVGLLPGGVDARSVYGLPVFTPQQMTDLRAEARRVADQERQAAAGGIAPAVPPAAAGIAIPGPAPPLPAVVSHDPGVVKWLAAEKCAGLDYGQEVPGVAIPAVKGAKHVHTHNGQAVFIECVDGADLHAFMQKPSGCDNRILAVEFNAIGHPERSLKDVAAMCKEVPVKWVLTGPRTARWCVSYLAVENLGFEGHHERLRQVTKADASSWGIQEHFQVSMALRQGLLVDQLDAYNLLSIEVQFRRLQTIEFSYSEKAKELESKSVGGRLSLEEQTTFGGITRQYSTLMICPELLDFVKSETEKEASLAKNLRKAREERESARKGKRGGGKDEALRVSEGYDALPTSSPLGSYNPENISLPTSGMVPVPLASLWGDNGQQQVEDFALQHSLDAATVECRLEQCGVTKCYQDPKFNSSAIYGDFLRRLHDINMIEYSLEPPAEQVGVFFVKKKSGMLRLILDCRRSNCHFSDPKPIQLATGEAMSRMQLPPGERLYTASADLQNAFYTMAMPEPLRKYFGLKRITAGTLGLQQLNGVTLGSGQWVYPRVTVVPMGWSWAMWWCQTISERICERSGLGEHERLRDSQAAPNSKFWHIQYVDNLHVFGTCQKEVEQRFWRAVEELRSAGLTVHEIEMGDHSNKVLGWQIDDSGVLRPGRERLWRIRLAIREILKRNRCSGQQLERLIGHITFISLCRREALSVLGECYTFIQRFYHCSVPLWKSVRKELSKWDGIAPLIFCNLTSEWSSQIYAVDASEWGLGVTTGTISTSYARDLGRHTERWRFKHAWAANPRRLIQHEEDELVANPSEEFVDHNKRAFATAGFEAVGRSWQVVGRHRWRRRESMPVYEARSSQFAVRHALRSTGNFGKRFIILTDSMTAAVAFDKGRAQTFRLRHVIEQTSALSLCSGSIFRARWIPTTWTKPQRVKKNAKQPKTTAPLPVSSVGSPSGPLTWDIELSEEPAKVKQQRRSQRRKNTRSQNQLNLREASVSPRTLVKYREHWESFLKWAGKTVQQITNRSMLDNLVTGFLEFLYLEGEDLSKANYVTAAILFHCPYAKGLSGLPMAQQSMKGWRRLCPPRSRMPIPYEAACLLSKKAMEEDKVEIALVLQLCYLLYLRPGEPFRLRAQDIVPPVKKAVGTSTYVSPSTRRCFIRGGKQASRSSRHPSSRQVDDNEEREELRKGRSASSAVHGTRQDNKKSGHRRKRQHRQAAPTPALLKEGLLKVAVFLEIFSGCGRLGSSVSQFCGWPVLLWDISYGEAYDLTKRCNRQKILHWINSGVIRGGHLGTPCNSFSRARDRPGGPPALRSDSCPLGFQSLKPHDLLKVKIGNILMYFTCAVLRLALHWRIPFSLENPQRSRLWICPPVSRLMKRRFSAWVDVHFCFFGTRWKKPTRVFGVHLPLDSLSNCQCHGSRRGVCQHSGLPHIPLMGQNSQGMWYTKLAEPYPKKFANALSRCFNNSELALIATNFQRHLQ